MEKRQAERLICHAYQGGYEGNREGWREACKERILQISRGGKSERSKQERNEGGHFIGANDMFRHRRAIKIMRVKRPSQESQRKSVRIKVIRLISMCADG